MKQILENLREQEYVNADNVEALRKYIRVKNPNGSREELSAVFADALHKIIDTRLYQFEEKHRGKIKDDVLKKAVKKKDFSINAAEVFNSCLSLKLHEDRYVDSFTQWINQNQSITVSARKVDKLVSSVELLEEEYIENNLDDIIDEFETSWAEDETLTMLGLEITEVAKSHIYEEIPSISDEEHIELIDTIESEWIEKIKEFIDTPVYEAESAVEEAIAQPDIDEVQEADLKLVCEGPALNNEALDLTESEIWAPHRFDVGKLLGSNHKLAALLLRNLKYIKPSMKLALPVALPLIIITGFVLNNLFTDNRIHALQYKDQGKYANISECQVDRYISLESKVMKKLDGFKSEKDLILSDGMHKKLKYEDIDGKKLKEWLNKKNSILAEEPYFTAILVTSKQYDIHPLLMFAIVGQEQAFVPKSGAAAKKIANNPFNVYGSWEKYNTDIYDSSRLAADVIIKSSRNRPVYMNTIRWINRRYAEDPNWWNGVSMLFAQMEKDIAN